MNPFSLNDTSTFVSLTLSSPLSTQEQPQHITNLSKQLINLSLSVSDTSFSSAFYVDPDNLLQPNMKSLFRSLLSDFDSVFDPTIQGYHGATGPFEVKVNHHNERVICLSMRRANLWTPKTSLTS